MNTAMKRLLGLLGFPRGLPGLAGMVVVAVILAVAALPVACGATEESMSVQESSAAAYDLAVSGGEDGLMASKRVAGESLLAVSAPAAAPMPAPAAQARPNSLLADTAAGAAPSGNAGRESLAAIDRKVISTAYLSVEVEAVEPAIDRARAIAQDLGGFLEQLSSSGGSEDPLAELTVRVPQPQFEEALERIEALGLVQSRNLGSEDVTEQFIDLSARLTSSQREEQSLLALLERSGSVTEILTVERELARVRSDIERTQGQLNFLERRIDLATIRLSLFTAGSRPGNPPVANYTMGVSSVSRQVDRLKTFVAGLDGEIDRVYLATYETEERGEVSFRVFLKDFDRAVTFIEGQGRVQWRELREGINPDGQDAPPGKRPSARVEVAYVDEYFQFQPWLIGLGVAAALALAGAVAYLMRLAYRRGRRRGSFI